MNPIAALDHQYVWHPFTQMRDWLQREPIVLSKGKGTLLYDVHGREYLDANSSIWTNLHGHAHPKINSSIRQQLKQIAHSSALGFANEPASLLAEKLIALTRQPSPSGSGTMAGAQDPLQLAKVFYSDDGSTAMEVALKLAYEFARRTGRSPKPKFLSLEGAYHGDTVGAVSLGHIPLFHKAYSGLLFKSDSVPSPYCYRCPFNRAQPERADARSWRKCNSECITAVEKRVARQRKTGHPYAAMVVEPVMQGAAGMIAQPQGWLQAVHQIIRADGGQLIADEVMTGFGRMGISPTRALESSLDTHGNPPITATLFASHREGVRPDFLALAKGLTGGYLPMAATLTTQSVFDAFLGNYEEFKTFFHGHSYTANQLGASAALASLELLDSKESIDSRARLQQALRTELASLWEIPVVGDIRQEGTVAGIELVRDWRTREAFRLEERAGIRVCEAMAARGVLTRPIGNVVVLMPPYCTTPKQVRRMVGALREACLEVFSEIR
jgi:adenosylmethionine---8-amino-7-oxononanoate aminotransferase